MDHSKLNADAMAASVRKAKEMGLAPGDEVTNGIYTYRIIEVTTRAVRGMLVAEHGHFVRSSDTTYFVDLRAGWARILREG